MFSEKVDGRRLSAWICVAAVAPAAGIYGGSWLPVAILGAACGLASVCFHGLQGEEREYGPVCSTLQWIWLCIYLGSVAPLSAGCWEGENVYPIIPLVLLLLAAFASADGAERASRACATLVWIVLAVVLAVILAGVDTLKWDRLVPEVELPRSGIIPILLLPCLLPGLPHKGRIGWVPSLFIPVFTLIVSVWVNAALSKTVCFETGNPFYEYCKGITLFGSVERFEAVIACVLTASWFALFSFVLSAAGRQFHNRWGVWCAAASAAVMVLLRLRAPDVILALGTVVFWCLLPLKKVSKR